ncbi:hypothetical protein F5Y06DRAFT_308339 [Hypoxylon sp. FL0890]|nr:hypothetical protein F5Y06DRAFT_308339 [Hypoxylon sp. FL0890]
MGTTDKNMLVISEAIPLSNPFIKMPYLNPENENKKAKEYFDNNKNRITDFFHKTIPYFDEVRFFFAEVDETPYLAIILRANCPWEPRSPQIYYLDEIIKSYA